MRVLLALTDGLRTVGGAALASAALLRRLARDHGHEGLIAAPHPLAATATLEGVEVVGYRDLHELLLLARRRRPDVLVGALAASIDAMRVAQRFDVPGVLCIHNYDLCEPTADEKRAWGIHEDCPFPDPGLAAFALRAAGRVFACSRHMQRFLEDRRGVVSDVLYSEWDPESFPAAEGPPRDGSITAACGFRHKGIDVFLHLARAFPGERFLLAGDLDGEIALGYRRLLRAQPNVELPGRLTTAELLRRSKVVLVPSRWPEPFGRLAVEAMAHGVPVLASLAGGLAEILGDAPMGVTASTDAEDWRRRLGALLASEELRHEYAARGRRLAAPFLGDASTRRFAAALGALAAAGRPRYDGGPLVVVEGLGGIESSAIINERWRRALSGRGMTCRPAGADARELPDVVIHHDYRRDLLTLALPDAGHAVAVRSWDFGPYPPDLVERINAEYDQLWLYSRWVVDQALASGIGPELVRHVPPGIDAAVYRPDGPRFRLPVERAFAFLFVGGTVLRKGIDILLAAYRRAFSAADDVCLVIKDSSTNVFFAGKTWHEEIRRAMDAPTAPLVVHLDGHLPETELAALYRRSDVAVFPYRAEGFALPILEAMACGTPAVAPRFGPCLDYCTDETSFLVPVRRIRLPVGRRMPLGSGLEYRLPGVDFCEIRVETLAEHLRRAYEAGAAARARLGAAGVAVAHGRFTWEHSAARVEACLAELLGPAPPRRLAAARLVAARAHRRRAAALRLAPGPVAGPPGAAGHAGRSRPDRRPAGA